ncbi:MAG: PadR family transcriptional regulator [Chloroflexi bacterium]|uniref:PadR family transcriptional regulator n=1 Tax=Candidatus Flexifilum breve TaxID=3140694 RepID=UPI0031370172|nr:PadR family transcriptional regulator [Chloroflexota bacterium]
MLKYALLGFLNYQTLSGYDLKRIMDTSTANFWHADLSQIYKALKALEADGLISSAVQAQDDRPDRRLYTITEDGRADLRDWLEEPLAGTPPLKETLLLKVFFSAQADRDHLLTQLVIQRELHRQALARYQGQTLTDIEQNAAFMGATPEDALFWDLTRRAGVLYEEMYLQWLDEAISRLKKRRGKKDQPHP